MNASSHETAVVVKNLEKRFGSFTAVNRVSFEVQKGEIFGFPSEGSDNRTDRGSRAEEETCPESDPSAAPQAR